MELGLDGALDIDECPPNGEDVPECRVILEVRLTVSEPLTVFPHLASRV